MAKGIDSACPLPSIHLTSVLFVPDSPFNMISISKLTRDLNCLITFSNNFVTLQDRTTGRTIGIKREFQGLFHLSSPSSSTACTSMYTHLLIHSRLGHQNISKFRVMIPHFFSLSSIERESCQLRKHTCIPFPKQLDQRAKSPFELVHIGVLPGLSLPWGSGRPNISKFWVMVTRFSNLSSIECESCYLGKHTRVSFPKQLDQRTKSPFEFFHTDVWGHSRTESTLGFQYFITFINDYSRCTWLFLMKTRAKSFSIFHKCHAEVRTQFNISICILRSDNAKEYLFGPFSSFLSSHEILHQSSCTYTPQQNGVVECKNRHLVKTVRTLLLHHKVPQRFLGNDNLANCYLINRMSSSVLHYLIPFFLQTNLSSAFPLVSLVVFVLSIFLLLDKTSFHLKPRSVSSSVIPGFNKVIIATLLIHINTLSLSMSHFLRTLLCSLSTTLPVLMS